jgi:hypothetical protein
MSGFLNKGAIHLNEGCGTSNMEEVTDVEQGKITVHLRLKYQPCRRLDSCPPIVFHRVVARTIDCICRPMLVRDLYRNPDWSSVMSFVWLRFPMTIYDVNLLVDPPTGFGVLGDTIYIYTDWTDDHFCFNHSSKDESMWGRCFRPL